MSRFNKAKSLEEDMLGKTVKSVVLGDEHPAFTRMYKKIAVRFDDGNELVFYPSGDYIQVP